MRTAMIFRGSGEPRPLAPALRTPRDTVRGKAAGLSLPSGGYQSDLGERRMSADSFAPTASP
jgi:hypothetical protein